jgi:DNA-binding transcriptional MocR family regulator
MSLKSQLKGGATLLSVDRRAQKPIHKQIYEAFRTRIVHRELRPGQLVTSTRKLAHELRVSRFPVLNACAQLLAEGYFESRVGAGTFVASSLPEEPLSRRRRTVVKSAPELSRTIPAGASTLPSCVGPSWREGLGPFQVGQPELEAFPLKRMHLTILIGDMIRDDEIAGRAAERRLRLSALSLSCVGDAPRRGFVLGFGNTRASQIPGAVRLLKRLLKA